MQTSTLIQSLSDSVGRPYVLFGARKTAYYRRGFRSGNGTATAVVFPATLLEQWLVLKVCVQANAVVIMQAANTGLTEGSTPSGDDYDRKVIIINTMRMNKIQVLDNGKQIISFPGATLYDLEKKLEPLQREPHSVIGSTCIGASIIGGVANNSGGAMVKRGPAYTEFSLFARRNENRELELVNHLGIALGNSAEEILCNLENQRYQLDKTAQQGAPKASAKDYESTLRNIHSSSPARYNADSKRLHEASGCAGKLAIFAVRLDTFAAPQKKQTFYIGTNQIKVLTELRKTILTTFEHLPDSAEYIHKNAYDIAERYGRDVFVFIDMFGTNAISKLLQSKGKATTLLNKIPLLPKDLPDRFLQLLSRLIPTRLPKRMRVLREHCEHHLVLETSDRGIAEAEALLSRLLSDNTNGRYFACDSREAKLAQLHRFVTAGAAARYATCHSNRITGVLPLDIALRRDDEDWFETLPDSISQHVEHALYYGHFLCHVMHQDYIVKQGCDIESLKNEMLVALKRRGAKYPAEHNVGHLYEAEEHLKEFYKELDPTNTFNPGIGKTSKLQNYQPKS